MRRRETAEEGRQRWCLGVAHGFCRFVYLDTLQTHAKQWPTTIEKVVIVIHTCEVQVMFLRVYVSFRTVLYTSVSFDGL